MSHSVTFKSITFTQSRVTRVAPWLSALVVMAGCSFTSQKPKPAALEPTTGGVAARVVWKQKIEDVRFPLVVNVQPGVFTVAGSEGTVMALQAETGQTLWRASVGTPLSAGVGSDGRFAAVVTTKGELVTLDSGKILWREPLNVKVTTPPLVAGERVFVLAQDRSVWAFDAASGQRLWRSQRGGDPLTLTQASVLAPFGNTLLVAQAARLQALNPDNSTVIWETAVASPRGTNEIERLADLVGPAARVSDTLCLRAFQATVGCLNGTRGSMLWSKPFGGTRGVAADTQYVVAADASDRINAWQLANGESAWSSDKLLYRGLGSPLSVGKSVVFGDESGLLHFLSRENGQTLQRLATDGSAVEVTPALTQNNLMLVVTRNGGLYGVQVD
jgi:outer membrane protein assembly factor BamB